MVSRDLPITVIAILAVCFILLGIVHPYLAERLGLDEGSLGQRFYSIVIGIALLMLLIVYRYAKEGMAGLG